MAEQRGIGEHVGQSFDAPVGAGGGFDLSLGEHGRDERGGVHAGAMHWSAAEARKIQQLVDERAHALRGGLDRGEEAAALRIEARTFSLGEQRGKSREVAQRRAQVMRDGIGKRFELAVRGFEFGAVFLELPVQLGHALFGATAFGDVVDRAAARDVATGVVVDRGRAQGHVERGAVLALELEFQVVDRAGLLEAREIFHEGVLVRRSEQVGEIFLPTTSSRV